jgi:hypothetical protein
MNQQPRRKRTGTARFFDPPYAASGRGMNLGQDASMCLVAI